MSQCDYDVVFYRVFCVTLLAVAFTFTVILTNVFVDIDGLLSNKKKYIPETTPVPEAFVNFADIPAKNRKEQFSNEYKNNKNYDIEINPSYRTKRSIESDTTYHSKSPTMKKMLTRRLATLLEELDEEEAKKVESTTAKEVVKVAKKEKHRTEGIRNEDLLHLAMHNILLQGLIGHMDLNDVYNKIHVLVETFNKRINNNKYAQDKKINILESIVNSKENILKDISGGAGRYNYNEENQFFEEIMKCKKLEKQIARTSLSKEINTASKNKTGEDDKVLIKTVIEINEINRSKGPNRTHPKENIEGLIKLIYNGKLIKVNQLLDETKSQNISKNNTDHEIEQVTNPVVSKDSTANIDPKISKLNQNNRKHTQSTFLNQVFEEYLKKHSVPKHEYLQNSAEFENIKSQRLKRQIRIQYSDNSTLSKTKPVHGEVKKDEDDLFIEIETHFDGKGIKGEKKKKIVRSLIDKIQKALNSDMEQKRDSDEHIKFIKRTQDPIYSQNKMSLINKIAPLEPIEHRQLDPIGKTLETHENIVDKAGDTWKKKFGGPNFLSVSKSVNSAEMNELIVDYDSVLRNGISKRLQKPLNTESMTNDEDDSAKLTNPYPGNLTLFLKDIDGSGFSIGFNQYAGEPPDKESLKMFDGIENLIREYHKRYDEPDNISNEPVNNKENNLGKMDDEIAKNNEESSHKVYRRSITQVGRDYYNANIDKTVSNDDPTFQRYLNIFKRGNHVSKLKNSDNMISDGVHTLHVKPSLKSVPIIVDERIISKKLKPAEILTIANLIKRKRRSVSVKKISNLKSKIKLNRYINTKTMEDKKVFFKRKRNKRQVSSIRVAARDRSQLPQKSSDENIFFISRENSYLDKDTSLRAVETADSRTNIKRIEYIDEESPFDNIYRIQNPNYQTTQTENLHNVAQRSKGLMSKYPHIFLDKSSNSKEIYFDETQYTVNKQPYRIQASPRSGIINQEMKITTEHNFATVLQDLVSKELVGAIIPQPSEPKYKITVKMLPKNKTSSNGFKEVHTSVNKSFDNNGLRYYTLLNVSQISKIEKLNKTDKRLDVEQPIRDHLFNQQKEIKNLLKLHKRRVDLQLNGLLRESDHLEQMIEASKTYSIDNPIHLLTDIYKDRDTENVEKALDSVRIRQESNITESNSLNTTQTTSDAVTLLPPSTDAPKTDKSIIIDIFKQNENITLEILKKIDKNTQILQKFLQKISERIDLDKKEHTTNKNETTERAGIEVKLDLSKDWKANGGNQNAFFIPNELKNDTIPFVYAYQQSIPLKSKTPQSLASMVYHGHIHTNPVQTINKPVPKVEPKVINTDNSRKKFNESKFFLDEVDNFQVTPDNNMRVISANIKINTTNVK